MKLQLKEEPREWRKNALLSTLGLALLSSLLRWRRVISPSGWLFVVTVLGILAIAALLRPRWFRGYYRLSGRLGFRLAQGMGYVLLSLVFVGLMTPLALLWRLLGKDPLRLRRPRHCATYWNDSKQSSALDKLF